MHLHIDIFVCVCVGRYVLNFEMCHDIHAINLENRIPTLSISLSLSISTQELKLDLENCLNCCSLQTFNSLYLCIFSTKAVMVYICLLVIVYLCTPLWVLKYELNSSSNYLCGSVLLSLQLILPKTVSRLSLCLSLGPHVVNYFAIDRYFPHYIQHLKYYIFLVTQRKRGSRVKSHISIYEEKIKEMNGNRLENV